MKYVVTHQNLGCPDASVVPRGTQLDEAQLGNPERIADLLERGFIEALEVKPPPLEEMTKKQLLSVAIGLGLEIDPKATRADILAAIEAAEPSEPSGSSEESQD